MLPTEVPWERRVTTVVLTATWLALAVGIVTSVVQSLEPGGDPGAALGAAGVGSLWVIVATVVPVNALRRPWILEGLVLFGVLSTMAAVGLSGDVESPFILLSLTPTMFAAINGGFRVGLGTAGLSGAVLAVMTFVARGDALPSWATIALYLAVGATIAQIRRLLLDLQQRTDRLTQASAESEQRLHSLENAHTLLERVASITGSADTGPLAVGRLAVEMVCEQYPGAAAMATIKGDEGPIMVARSGVVPDPSVDTVIPLIVGDREVGAVTIKSAKPLRDDDRRSLETGLRPLALAFSNALLLQEISGNAVKAERVRLARELHDEIGPGLASLGLALDLALVQGSSQNELTQHIETLRGRVTEIVDEVRSTVSDLRTGRSESLRSTVDKLVVESNTDIQVSFEVDERRPVRPSLSDSVYGIAGEALRNAIRHSGAGAIRITGWCDFDRGRVVVEDDGSGFDPSVQPKGHFGVMGMHERAADAGIVLDIVSGEGGTRVLIEWS